MNVYLSKQPNESKRHIFYNPFYYKIVLLLEMEYSSKKGTCIKKSVRLM